MFPELVVIYLDIAQNLQKQNSYIFDVSNKKNKLKKFKVIVGTEEFIKQNSEGIPLVPLKFALFQNYPNPFNPMTTVSFNVSKRTPVQIYIYNILGQRVRILIDEEMRAGHHRLIWDGCNDYGTIVTTGLYFVRLKAESKTAVKKMMIIK